MRKRPVGILLLVLLAGCPTPDPAPTPPYPKPNERIMVMVWPVTKCRMHPNDAAILAAMYAELSVDIQYKAWDNARLREEFVIRGVPLQLQGKYHGLAEAVDEACTEAFGLVAYKPVNPDFASEFLLGLAWAVEQTAESP
jgi:hypothetical protein